jgi:hypothetical protein
MSRINRGDLVRTEDGHYAIVLEVGVSTATVFNSDGIRTLESLSELGPLGLREGEQPPSTANFAEILLPEPPTAFLDFEAVAKSPLRVAFRRMDHDRLLFAAYTAESRAEYWAECVDGQVRKVNYSGNWARHFRNSERQQHRDWTPLHEDTPQAVTWANRG